MYLIPSQHVAHIICMGKAWKRLIQTWKVKWSSKPFGIVLVVLAITFQEAVSGCHLKKLDQLLIATRFLLLFWQVWCRNTNNKRFVASCQLDTTILDESCWKPNTGDKTCQTVLIHPTFCWGNYTRIYQNTFYRSSNLTYFVQSQQAQVSQCFLPTALHGSNLLLRPGIHLNGSDKREMHLEHPMVCQLPMAHGVVIPHWIEIL